MKNFSILLASLTILTLSATAFASTEVVKPNQPVFDYPESISQFASSCEVWIDEDHYHFSLKLDEQETEFPKVNDTKIVGPFKIWFKQSNTVDRDSGLKIIHSDTYVFDLNDKLLTRLKSDVFPNYGFSLTVPEFTMSCSVP